MRASGLWLAAQRASGLGGTRPPRLSPGGGNGKGGASKFPAAAGHFRSRPRSSNPPRIVALVGSGSAAQSRLDAVTPQHLQMVQCLFPALHRVPFLNHVSQRQIDQLKGRFFARKRAARLDDFAQAHMQRFHRIGRVDDLPHLGRKLIVALG